MRKSVYVVAANDHDYDAGSDWIVGAYSTKVKAKRAIKKALIDYAEENGQHGAGRFGWRIRIEVLKAPIDSEQGAYITVYHEITGTGTTKTAYAAKVWFEGEKKPE